MGPVTSHKWSFLNPISSIYNPSETPFFFRPFIGSRICNLIYSDLWRGPLLHRLPKFLRPRLCGLFVRKFPLKITWQRQTHFSPWTQNMGTRHPWVFPKIGKHPKMDGENNGKPIKMDDLGISPLKTNSWVPLKLVLWFDVSPPFKGRRIDSASSRSLLRGSRHIRTMKVWSLPVNSLEITFTWKLLGFQWEKSPFLPEISLCC